MRSSSWLRSMRSLFVPEGTRQGRRPTSFPSKPFSTRLVVDHLEDRAVPTIFMVSNLGDSGTGSLRQAILDANATPGADQVRFTPAARDGTISLTSGQLSISGDLQIDGPGAGRLAISGNDASRIFQIGSGVVVSIDDLTITHGHAVGPGGGILNSGNLTLTRAVVSNNVAVGLPGATLSSVVDAFGGGIFNSGTLTVSNTCFVHNQAIGADGASVSIGSSALGGAIMSNGTPIAPATVTISFSTFLDNQATGGAAGIGASRAGVGGAINNATSTLTVSRSVFHNNQAIGGIENGVPGGFGAGIGGAISNVARFGSAFLSVSHSTLTNNRAVGGAAGTSIIAQNGRGGAIANYIFGGLIPPVTVTATAQIDHSTILGNKAIGGAGPSGGTGLGGGIANENGGVLTVTDSLIVLNQAIGGTGNGGNGGDGLGGGIFNGVSSSVGTPSLTLQESLIALNHADGGSTSGGGDVGQGEGGGLYLGAGGVATADLWTLIFANDATTNDDDVFGVLL